MEPHTIGHLKKKISSGSYRRVRGKATKKWGGGGGGRKTRRKPLRNTRIAPFMISVIEYNKELYIASRIATN